MFCLAMAGEKELTSDTNLREAVHETISCLLSPHQDVRQAGEIRIKALEVTEDFGVLLAELIVNRDIDVALRQLASVMLKHYAETHWCNYSEKFSPPETSESAKGKIKSYLPYALEDPASKKDYSTHTARSKFGQEHLNEWSQRTECSSPKCKRIINWHYSLVGLNRHPKYQRKKTKAEIKVRSSAAYAISAIAHWDWPESWPELFDILVRYLRNSENEWGVHGAMRVLSEISHDLTDTQLPHVAPVILSEMYRIFADEEKFGIRVRGRAVEVFTTCAFMISAMSDYHTGAIKQLLNPVLPSFSEKFILGLTVPDGLHSDSCLKTDIIKAITLLLQQVPKQMVRWLHEILPPVWQILIQSAETYLKTVVNDAEHSEQLVDSDGEILGFEKLIFSIFEFVHVLVEYPKFSKTVDSALSDLLYYLIVFMQITEEQEQSWRRNPNQFVEDEDDTFSYSVRLSALDLLVILCTEYEGGCTALCQAVTKHVSHSEVGSFFSTRTSPFWWKTHEACMLALGSVHNLLTEKLESGNVHFDLTGFLQNVVTADMNMTGHVFLLGRCLWFGSRYANFLPVPMLEQFLQATTTALHPGQMLTIRISAVRAIWGFCEHLKQSSSVEVLTTFLPSVIEHLLSMATEFSCEILGLVLEALAVILSIDNSCTAAHSSKVISLAIAVFLKYNSDPLILTLAQEVFKELSQNSECLIPLQQRLVPTLVSILNAAPDKIVSGLHSVALDVLQTLVRYSKPPLSEMLMNSAFPAAALCILRSDDSSTLQSGGECLRTYVSVAPEQVCNYQDNEGHSGLWYILQVAALLLNPSTSEHSATFVGRLVTTLITKAGGVLGENLDFLLKAVLSKMQRAETLSVFQSLVMIYAHLIHNRLEDVLNFLASVPGPSGQSALEFVLAKWCSSQHLFYGAYEGKVSIIALCKLLEHGISSNDKRLNDITVKGDEMFMSDAIRTRSQTQCQAPVFTTIPLLVKIFKLLVNELNNQMEANAASDGSDDTDYELEEDSNWEERGEAEQRLGNLSRKDEEIVDDDDEDEPDILSDPVYHLNIQQYLTDFFQTFSQQPYFPQFLQHLNKEEKKVLSSIGIHV